ncbi:hypothetical protein ABIE27_003749 [Paenibacillus sp. 4624]|uniref:S-layer homology domain-containing protein n=1 Tax=Paenibacillus sp. 4624 TaxID=3156453 RepID=UPI003D1D42A6
MPPIKSLVKYLTKRIDRSSFVLGEGKVTWTVRNPSIANVTSGTVTGKAACSTVVSAVYGAQSVDINITVTGTPVSGSGSSPSSSSNTSTSIDNSTPAKTEPSIPPAKEIIEAAAKAGLLEDKSPNRFEPDANLTRAEALTVIMCMLRKNPTIDQLLG